MPAVDGPTHPYFGAAPGCWALYGEVLAREYADPRLGRLNRLTADAYAAQHPGRPEPRAVQSVAVHLIGLRLERPATSRDLAPVLQAAVRTTNRDSIFRWLERPPSLGALTVADVHAALDTSGDDPPAHLARVRAWAEGVWAAWAPHHAEVRTWAAVVTADGRAPARGRARAGRPRRPTRPGS